MSYIKSFSVGDGDSFYIEHNLDNFSIIDCGFCSNDQERVVDEIVRRSADKGIVRVIVTHPDEDHISGLPYLDSKIGIVNFYCVKNNATKNDKTEAFERYCELRDGSHAYYVEKGCRRKWMNLSDEERGSAGINFLWPDVDNASYKEQLSAAAKGDSPNNICPMVTYRLEEGVTAMWMGDLESSFMAEIEDCVEIPRIDILFAPHHGRSSGRPPKSWMDAMSPKIVVIGEADSCDLDYYGGYTTICQNTAGDIAFDCESGYVHIYTRNSYSINGAEWLRKAASGALGYRGSLRGLFSYLAYVFAVKHIGAGG